MVRQGEIGGARNKRCSPETVYREHSHVCWRGGTASHSDSVQGAEPDSPLISTRVASLDHLIWPQFATRVSHLVILRPKINRIEDEHDPSCDVSRGLHSVRGNCLVAFL